ncbi:hypothetical protein [Clostridium perfringens]|uniref:hypothetical protein n=1 Tax=Clostridium perfringens TaxID=1502 RepID=UPI002FCD577E
MKKINKIARIDTCTMETSISNIVNIGKVVSPIANPYKRGTNLEKGRFQVVLKPHKILGKRKGEELYINKKSTLEKVLKREMCRMGVIDLDKVDYTRVDIAIDRPEKFEECLKETRYLFHLLSLEFRDRELWYNKSFRDNKTSTFKATGRSFGLSFYDKEKESNGTFPYKTRYEFRFKRLKGIDLDKYINKIIDKLKDLDERINTVELEAINLLTKKFEEEIEKNIVANLTEFVRKYELFIYNGNILKGLYKTSGLKGSYSKWLEKYRTKRELKLISDTAIKKQIDECIRALKLYKNDGVGNRILTPFFFLTLLTVGFSIKNIIDFNVCLS